MFLSYFDKFHSNGYVEGLPKQQPFSYVEGMLKFLSGWDKLIDVTGDNDE